MIIEEDMIKAIDIFPWNPRSSEGWSECLREQGNVEDFAKVLKSFSNIYEVKRKEINKRS